MERWVKSASSTSDGRSSSHCTRWSPPTCENGIIVRFEGFTAIRPPPRASGSRTPKRPDSSSNLRIRPFAPFNSGRETRLCSVTRVPWGRTASTSVRRARVMKVAAPTQAPSRATCRVWRRFSVLLYVNHLFNFPFVLGAAAAFVSTSVMMRTFSSSAAIFFASSSCLTQCAHLERQRTTSKEEAHAR